MSAEKNNISPPPVDRRLSSRKRDSPDFFVPTPFRRSPQLHGQGLRRGPGRPPKQRSDESSASQPLQRGPGSPQTKRSDESSASQPLRRGPGRPQTKRSDAPTNGPEMVLPPPVPPTGSTGTNSEQAPPPPVPPTGSTGTNSEQVPPPPVPPSGSINDTPLLIPCDEEDGQRETQLKLNPLSRLKTPQLAHSSQIQMPEKSKKVITDEVHSVLVSHLTSGTATSVDDMVDFANSNFSILDSIGDDYGSFYEDVKNMISYKYDLFTAERDGDMCPVSELEKQGLDAVVRANNIEKEIEHTQAKREKDKENKEQLKILIEDARENIRQLEQVIPRLERQVADIEQNEKCTKDDEQKHREAHRIAQAEVEKFNNQTEAARVVQRDIEQRKTEALQRIEATTRSLLSYVKGKERSKT